MARINPKMYLMSGKIGVIDDAQHMIGFYNWDVKLERPIALMDVNELLMALRLYDVPERKKKSKDHSDDAPESEEGTVIEEFEDKLTIQDRTGVYQTHIKIAHKENIEDAIRDDEAVYQKDVSENSVLITTEMMRMLVSHITLMKLDGERDRLTMDQGKLVLGSRDATTSNGFEIKIDGLEKFPKVMAVGSRDFRRIYSGKEYELRTFWGGVFIKSTDGELSYYLSYFG